MNGKYLALLWQEFTTLFVIRPPPSVISTESVIQIPTTVNRGLITTHAANLSLTYFSYLSVVLLQYIDSGIIDLQTPGMYTNIARAHINKHAATYINLYFQKD